MNAPTPASALNILARPEKSASPKSSANDSGTSFSNALTQQQSALSNQGTQAATKPATQDRNVAKEQTPARQNDAQEHNPDTQQTSDQRPGNEITENQVNLTTPHESQHTNGVARQETGNPQVLSPGHETLRASLIHGLPTAAGEGNRGSSAESNLKPNQNANIAATPLAAKSSVLARNGAAEHLSARSGKMQQASGLNLQETAAHTSEKQVHTEKNRESQQASLQTTNAPAGAAIAKTVGHGPTGRPAPLSNVPDTHRLNGGNLERLDTLFSRADNTSVFLDRVVEARRLSGQPSLQNITHNHIANTSADRTVEGLEGLPNLIMPGAHSAAFSLGSATVPTPLGHPEWARDFSQQVGTFSQHLRNGLQTIELRLDPPDLGPIRISLSLSDNVAQASFISPHAAVRNAIEQALPQLQEQLAQAGISLGQTSVGEQHQGPAQQAATMQAKPGVPENGSQENELPAQSQAPSQRTHRGQVDTFA